MDIFKKTKKKDFEIVSDIDAIVDKAIGFTLHGKDHRIEPVTTQRFFEWSSALSGLYNLKDKTDVLADDVIDAYYKAINTLCPTITKEDIKKCTQAQLSAVYGTILDHCSGRAHSDDYKKKVMTSQNSQASVPQR